MARSLRSSRTVRPKSSSAVGAFPLDDGPAKDTLCDFSKGSIGEDNARLLGSLIVIREKLAALARHDVPEEKRVPHVLYAEEAQYFIGDFPPILQEARKYRLILVLATQGIEQLSQDAAFAILTNCATLISFPVSGADAARMTDEFATLMPLPFCRICPTSRRMCAP